MPSLTAQLIRNDDCTLNQLTAELITAYQPVAYKQNSYFVNNVPEGLKLHIDKDGLATLMGSMFYIMASCSRDSCIEVSAEFYPDIILLHVKDTSTFNSYAIRSKRQSLQQLAEKIGGNLSMSKEHPKETSITFSFINSKATPAIQDHLMKPMFANGFTYA